MPAAALQLRARPRERGGVVAPVQERHRQPRQARQAGAAQVVHIAGRAGRLQGGQERARAAPVAADEVGRQRRGARADRVVRQLSLGLRCVGLGPCTAAGRGKSGNRST